MGMWNLLQDTARILKWRCGLGVMGKKATTSEKTQPPPQPPRQYSIVFTSCWLLGLLRSLDMQVCHSKKLSDLEFSIPSSYGLSMSRLLTWLSNRKQGRGVENADMASTLSFVMAAHVNGVFVRRHRTILTDLHWSIYARIERSTTNKPLSLLYAHGLGDCLSALGFNSSIIFFVLDLCLFHFCCDISHCILFLVKLCLGRHLAINTLVCSGDLLTSISTSAA